MDVDEFSNKVDLLKLSDAELIKLEQRSWDLWQMYHEKYELLHDECFKRRIGGRWWK